MCVHAVGINLVLAIHVCFLNGSEIQSEINSMTYYFNPDGLLLQIFSILSNLFGIKIFVLNRNKLSYLTFFVPG